MSAAGREMGVSPAVVSKRISLLEERLGARLFQRTTRQLTLTETGEGYFKRVVEILSLVEEADDFVSRRNTQPCGLLKVTAPTAFTRLHVMRFLPSFAERYPEIQLEMCITDAFCDLVRDGFDLAVRIGEMPDSSLVARKLCGDKRILCSSPRYLAHKGEPKTIEQLEKLQLVSTTSQDIWRLEGPGGPVNIRIRGNLKINSGDCARQALLAGLGVGSGACGKSPTSYTKVSSFTCSRTTADRRITASMPSIHPATSCPRRSRPSSSSWPAFRRRAMLGQGEGSRPRGRTCGRSAPVIQARLQVRT